MFSCRCSCSWIYPVHWEFIGNKMHPYSLKHTQGLCCCSLASSGMTRSLWWLMLANFQLILLCVTCLHESIYSMTLVLLLQYILACDEYTSVCSCLFFSCGCTPLTLSQVILWWCLCNLLKGIFRPKPFSISSLRVAKVAAVQQKL